MTKEQFSVYVIVAAVATAIASQIGLHLVDQATIKQCQSHDWPATADQQHRDWCIGNGYKI